MDGVVTGLRWRTLYALLFVPIICLTILGILLYVYLYTSGVEYSRALQWIDIAAEGSGVMWWSSLMWAFAALLCLLEFDRNQTWLRYYWLAIAVGSLLLSLDEAVQIHEHFGLLAGKLFGVDPWWFLAAIPIVGLCFLALIPFLMALPRKTAKFLFLSGAIFISGSVGLEMVFAYFVTTSPGSTRLLWILMTIEECLEMIGVALFCITVHDHLNRSRALEAT